MSEALKTILNLGEAVNDDNSTTDDTSQRINAALAGYARENIDDNMTDHEQELMRSV